MSGAWFPPVVRQLLMVIGAVLVGAGLILAGLRVMMPSKQEAWRKVGTIYRSLWVMFPLMIVPTLGSSGPP